MKTYPYDSVTDQSSLVTDGLSNLPAVIRNAGGGTISHRQSAINAPTSRHNSDNGQIGLVRLSIEDLYVETSLERGKEAVVHRYRTQESSYVQQNRSYP